MNWQSKAEPEFEDYKFHPDLKFFRKMKEKKGDMNEIEQQLQSNGGGTWHLDFVY